MQVKWLKLKNFRNYSECFAEFLPGVNLISGQNGQGKTNLVEGVMLNALSKSPYIRVEKEIIVSAMEKAGIAPDIRGEKLSLEEFAAITDYIEKG